jgi:hypothetical protein
MLRVRAIRKIATSAHRKLKAAMAICWPTLYASTVLLLATSRNA